ncbi:hypothetical protein EIP86_010459 [Pleurotus ostreatoroseus]|nr:hypothetical protein EIP86_010459 [Pleurotus ostreatoroseus]
MGVTDFVGIVDSKGQRELAVPFSHSMHTHICTGSSTATAYLTADVLSRPNLTVAVSVMTEKILFDSSGSEPRAIGVELSTSPTSTRYCARATREVILCAGAVGSPQLLMLSGVGPAQELQELEIPLVKDLSAVGKNLYDHISSGPLIFRATPGITWDYLNKPFSGAMALIKWLMFGKGPMATLPCTSGAFVRSDDPSLPLRAKDPSTRDAEVKDLTSGPNAPDIELVWFPLIALEGGFRQPPPGVAGITMVSIHGM